MQKSILLLALLASEAAGAQISTRTVASKPAKPAYDSTINIDKLDCQFEPSSIIGQEIHFYERTEYGKQEWPLDMSMNHIRYESNDKVYKPDSYKNTPYTALENKTFKILNWEILDEDDCSRKITVQDENGERIYWMVPRRFRPGVGAFINGYLEKLKQTYVNKNVYFKIDPNVIPYEYENPLDKQNNEFVAGSKWKCTELTFLKTEKSSFNQLALILQDSAKKEIAICITPKGEKFPDDKFLTQRDILTEEKYLAILKEEKRVRDSLLAKDKAERLQFQKELKARKASLIKEFGATNGNLIADGIVKPGMTKDMCREAWGSADRVLTSSINGTEYETWMYSYSGWLKFKNNKLVMIMQ
jgi:hypothetical protein